jgi:P-type Ca2+ transporter type 2C
MTFHRHQQDIASLSKELNTDIASGLSKEIAKERLLLHGYNELHEGKKRSWILKFLDQIKDFMIIVLIGASILSFISGDQAEGFLIIGIVVLNAILGLFQEAKAEKALESIKALSSPHAKVKRDGSDQVIDVKHLVIGDIVTLDAGDYVPADVRIIESINLKIDESALTGEAVPVEKIDEVLNEEEIPLGDRINLGYMGTVVTYGRGKALVYATGMNTEIGKIATMLTETKDELTPLQKSMAQLGKLLAIIALGITFVIFMITMVESYVVDGTISIAVFKEALLTAIALAVAAIPEGLPAIITIVLALGMQNLVKKQAIVRTLPAVETLGSTSIICSDKTGTLTQNLMTVQSVYTISGLTQLHDQEFPDELNRLGTMAILCNDTKVELKSSGYQKIGDPTEIALIDLGIMIHLNPISIVQYYPRLYELPFDSDRKLMTTVHDIDGIRYAIVKGAPDVIFKRTKHIHMGSLDQISLFEQANQNMSNQSLRILAVAYQIIDQKTPLKSLSYEDLEQNLTLYGLIGMMDPARPEVKDAIFLCDGAGIKTIMITGDHINTAVAIAKELSILHEHELAITGSELDTMDDLTFMDKIEKIRVYARVSPEHKVRIVAAWKAKGHVVAMTGDGVNDAPSIKKADIGIAMGITGTEVAKGAADMILTDDNFATIVNAVSEGRVIFANIRKAISYLLSSNIGEIITIFLGTTIGMLIFGMRVTTLTAVQILWVNLVTDSLMAISLGLDPREPDIMLEQPRKANQSIFANGLGKRIMFRGLTLGLISFLAYYIGWTFTQDPAQRMMTAQTMAFMVLALSQLVHAFNVRSEKRSIFQLPVNRAMMIAFLISATLQLSIVFISGTRHLFGIVMPSVQLWLIIIFLSLSPLLISEIQKIIIRKK